jgi:hypothetical protein
MEVNGEITTQPNFPQRKLSPLSILQEAGWTPEPVCTLWNGEKSYHAGNHTYVPISYVHLIMIQNIAILYHIPVIEAVGLFCL